MAVRRMSFARCVRDIAKAPKHKVWAFVGAERALIDMASSRLFQEINLPVRRITGKFSPVTVFHTMGELDLMAERWVVVLDGVKKLDRLEQFKTGLPEVLGDNYLVILGEDLGDDVQEWVSSIGRVVNCEKIENRKDLLDVMARIFQDQGIQLYEGSRNAVLALTGFSVGAIRNAAGLLRMYYAPGGEPVEIQADQVVEVVPSLNYEDVFTVVSEVLYKNLSRAIDYYQKLKQRSDVQWLFLDRLLTIFRDLWVFVRLGDLNLDQQQELGVDSRTYAKIRTLNPPSEQDLARIYKLILDVYQHSKSVADEDFVVEVLLVHIIKILQGEDVGPFPLIIRNSKRAPARPA